jgi:diguanylate cyclase (GGDEF)-like protein
MTQGKPETSNSQGFQHSVHVLDGITSWHVWSSALLILLLPATIIFLSFPALFSKLGLVQELGASLLVRGLLSVMWLAIGVTLYRQWSSLRVLRHDLIAQMDRATRSNVRAEQFYGMSIIDPLTGLYNRRFGETRLEEEIKRAEKSRAPLILLAIDFDRFKHINDEYGHAAGDLALKEFSRRLQRAIRACDVPIRMGGDEFLVILPDCPPDKIPQVFSRMGSIEITVDDRHIPVSFSYGMAQYEVNDTPKTLIARADDRLYAEKANGRDIFQINQDDTKKRTADREVTETTSDDLLGCHRAAITHPGRVRRSPRIPKTMLILVVGNDLGGKTFTEKTKVVEISQHGAVIVSQHKLALEQEIIIRCADTNRETEARVVHVIGSEPDTYTYGVALASSTTNFWDVEFAPLANSETASHWLLECVRCKSREILAPGSYATNDSAVRSCKRCGSATIYKRGFDDAASTNINGEPGCDEEKIAVSI